MARAMDSSEFVRRAKAVHGDDYDYDCTVYQNMRHKVCIRCKVHGEFWQLPQAHLNGQGCPVCGDEKQRATMLARYGADNPMKVQQFRDKARKTSLERFGCEWAASSPELLERRQATNQERYGGNSPICSDEVRAKIKATVRARYGVDSVSQVPEIRDRARQTCLLRYGVEEPLASDEIRRKIEETNRARYGGNAPMSSGEMRKKARETCLRKYGVAHVSQSPGVIQKCVESKASRGTFSTSSSEELLYARLCEMFGPDDIERQYVSEVYPFPCDFYVKSVDLYIELNGLWTHGGHWFDAGSDCDGNIVRVWSDRGTRYYQNAIHVWTVSDVRKRAAARTAGLNYIVFWDSRLRDADLWFSMGCPNGQDWDMAYSWLPEREIKGMARPSRITGTPSNLSLFAKFYQFDVFYSREMGLWSDNAPFRGLPLQVWLYDNRLKYLGKLPGELSDAEIMRGFTIAGVLKGHTVFNTSLMDKFVAKYRPGSIYDPCAGWGERLLYCRHNGIRYHGVDVNTALKPGYDRMLYDFAVTEQAVVFADSSCYVPSFDADAVVTCPPYGGTEIYSQFGAENLDDDAFLVWWDAVVRNSMAANASYFAFQVNQRWRDRMLSVVQANGFCLIDELMPDTVRASHFNRQNGVNEKREFESMLVLSR